MVGKNFVSSHPANKGCELAQIKARRRCSKPSFVAPIPRTGRGPSARRLGGRNPFEISCASCSNQKGLWRAGCVGSTSTSGPGSFQRGTASRPRQRASMQRVANPTLAFSSPGPSLRRETAISFSWSRIPRRSRFTVFRLWRDLPSTAAFLCVRNARCTCGRSAHSHCRPCRHSRRATQVAGLQPTPQRRNMDEPFSRRFPFRIFNASATAIRCP
jgi:hypothetical protein